MIVVTGAAGFIGCNIIKALNAQGRRDILAVGDLSNGHKFNNLVDCYYADYQDYQDFLEQIKTDSCFAEPIEVIFHQGACSDTTEWDGRYMMRNNYDYSKHLLHYCLKREISLIYASSAAVYGSSQVFDEHAITQQPLNVYGYSKWRFDQYALNALSEAKSQIVGLRYFNVYGPNEQHKAHMASVAFHLMNQLHANDEVKLYEGSHGYADGEQVRDFIYVNDVAKINLWFWNNHQHKGIFNVGTGQARSFNTIAETLIQLHGSGSIKYIPFPGDLKKAYQSYTQADITKLRICGFDDQFTSLEAGLRRYYEWHSGR